MRRSTAAEHEEKTDAQCLVAITPRYICGGSVFRRFKGSKGPWYCLLCGAEQAKDLSGPTC